MRARTLLVVAIVPLSGCAASSGDRIAPVSGGEVRAVLTSAEHRQLADYYAVEGRRLSAEAVEHERVWRSYEGLSLAVNDGIWARHCARRAARLREDAGASRALAALHAEQAAGDNNQGRQDDFE